MSIEYIPILTVSAYVCSCDPMRQASWDFDDRGGVFPIGREMRDTWAKSSACLTREDVLYVFMSC